MSFGSLHVLPKPGSTNPKTFAFGITKQHISIGRALNSDVRIQKRNVAVHHAEIIHEENKLWIKHIAHTGETFLNARKLEKNVSYLIEQRDRIRIEEREFRICYPPDSEMALGTENVDNNVRTNTPQAATKTHTLARPAMPVLNRPAVPEPKIPEPITSPVKQDVLSANLSLAGYASPKKASPAPVTPSIPQAQSVAATEEANADSQTRSDANAHQESPLAPSSTGLRSSPRKRASSRGNMTTPLKSSRLKTSWVVEQVTPGSAPAPNLMDLETPGAQALSLTSLMPPTKNSAETSPNFDHDTDADALTVDPTSAIAAHLPLAVETSEPLQTQPLELPQGGGLEAESGSAHKTLTLNWDIFHTADIRDQSGSGMSNHSSSNLYSSRQVPATPRNSVSHNSAETVAAAKSDLQSDLKTTALLNSAKLAFGQDPELGNHETSQTASATPRTSVSATRTEAVSSPLRRSVTSQEPLNANEVPATPRNSISYPGPGEITDSLKAKNLAQADLQTTALLNSARKDLKIYGATEVNNSTPIKSHEDSFPGSPDLVTPGPNETMYQSTDSPDISGTPYNAQMLAPAQAKTPGTPLDLGTRARASARPTPVNLHKSLLSMAAKTAEHITGRTPDRVQHMQERIASSTSTPMKHVQKPENDDEKITESQLLKPVSELAPSASSAESVAVNSNDLSTPVRNVLDSLTTPPAVSHFKHKSPSTALRTGSKRGKRSSLAPSNLSRVTSSPSVHKDAEMSPEVVTSSPADTNMLQPKLSDDSVSIDGVIPQSSNLKETLETSAPIPSDSTPAYLEKLPDITVSTPPLPEAMAISTPVQNVIDSLQTPIAGSASRTPGTPLRKSSRRNKTTHPHPHASPKVLAAPGDTAPSDEAAEPSAEVISEASDPIAGEDSTEPNTPTQEVSQKEDEPATTSALQTSGQANENTEVASPSMGSTAEPATAKSEDQAVPAVPTLDATQVKTVSQEECSTPVRNVLESLATPAPKSVLKQKTPFTAVRSGKRGNRSSLAPSNLGTVVNTPMAASKDTAASSVPGSEVLLPGTETTISTESDDVCTPVRNVLESLKTPAPSTVRSETALESVLPTPVANVVKVMRTPAPISAATRKPAETSLRKSTRLTKTPDEKAPHSTKSAEPNDEITFESEAEEDKAAESMQVDEKEDYVPAQTSNTIEAMPEHKYSISATPIPSATTKKSVESKAMTPAIPSVSISEHTFSKDLPSNTNAATEVYSTPVRNVLNSLETPAPAPSAKHRTPSTAVRAAIQSSKKVSAGPSNLASVINTPVPDATHIASRSALSTPKPLGESRSSAPASDSRRNTEDLSTPVRNVLDSIKTPAPLTSNTMPAAAAKTPSTSIKTLPKFPSIRETNAPATPVQHNTESASSSLPVSSSQVSSPAIQEACGHSLRKMMGRDESIPSGKNDASKSVESPAVPRSRGRSDTIPIHQADVAPKGRSSPISQIITTDNVRSPGSSSVGTSEARSKFVNTPKHNQDTSATTEMLKSAVKAALAQVGHSTPVRNVLDLLATPGTSESLRSKSPNTAVRTTTRKGRAYFESSTKTRVGSTLATPQPISNTISRQLTGTNASLTQSASLEGGKGTLINVAVRKDTPGDFSSPKQTSTPSVRSQTAFAISSLVSECDSTESPATIDSPVAVEESEHTNRDRISYTVHSTQAKQKRTSPIAVASIIDNEERRDHQQLSPSIREVNQTVSPDHVDKEIAQRPVEAASAEPIALRTRAGTHEPVENIGPIDAHVKTAQQSPEGLINEHHTLSKPDVTRSHIQLQDLLKDPNPPSASPISTRAGTRLKTPQPEAVTAASPKSTTHKDKGPETVVEEEIVRDSTRPRRGRPPTRPRSEVQSKEDAETINSTEPDAALAPRARRGIPTTNSSEPVRTARITRMTRQTTAEPTEGEPSEVVNRSSTRPYTRRNTSVANKDTTESGEPPSGDSVVPPSDNQVNAENAQPNTRSVSTTKIPRTRDNTHVTASSPVRGKTTKSLKRRHEDAATSPPKRTLRNRQI